MKSRVGGVEACMQSLDESLEVESTGFEDEH